MGIKKDNHFLFCINPGTQTTTLVLNHQDKDNPSPVKKDNQVLMKHVVQRLLTTPTVNGEKETPLAENILQQSAPEYFNTSFLLPGILDAAHVQTPVIDTGASVFRLH